MTNISNVDDNCTSMAVDKEEEKESSSSTAFPTSSSILGGCILRDKILLNEQETRSCLRADVDQIYFNFRSQFVTGPTSDSVPSCNTDPQFQ